MNAIANVKPRVQDILAQLGPDLYTRAFKSGVSLSAFLESEDPSHEYRDGLDAFGRLMQCAGIRTTSIPELGIWSDTMDAFDRDEHTRSLAPEWMARQWRQATTGRAPNTRALYTSADNIPGGVANPTFQSQTPVVNEIVPAIPLSAITAMQVGIRGTTYEAFYLTDVTAQERMVRVSEGAEIPRVKLAGADHTIRLKKYGRVMEITYEELRRQRIDLLRLHIQQLAAQTEADKVSAAMDVLVSGDGNSGTAATSYNLTTLDSAAVAGTLSLKGWLAFKMKFANPYMLTTALANEDVALQMQLLNVGSANVPLVSVQAASGFGGFTAINPGLRDNVALGWTADAPSLKIVAFDRRFALLYLTEVGSDIEEITRWATRQVQGVVMSEVNGFGVLNASGTKVLDVNA